MAGLDFGHWNRLVCFFPAVRNSGDHGGVVLHPKSMAVLLFSTGPVCLVGKLMIQINDGGGAVCVPSCGGFEWAYHPAKLCFNATAKDPIPQIS